MATTEVALAGLLPPLTDEEGRLLAALLHPTSKLSAIIPANVSRDELISNLGICCRVAVWADGTGRKINPVIGRILLVMKAAPEMYKAIGFETFSDFIVDYVYKKLGYSRSSAYESMRLAEAHPDLPIDRWLSIGSERLSLLAKFTRQGEPSYEKFLSVAEQSESTADLKQWAYDKGHLLKGDVDRATVIIECSVALAQHWKNFLSDPRAQATAGGASPEMFFAAMLAECSSFISEDGHRPVMEIAEVAFVWRCEKCGHCGIVPSGYKGSTLDDLRHYIHDSHHDADKSCNELVGNLLFIKADEDGKVEEAAIEDGDDEEPPIE